MPVTARFSRPAWVLLALWLSGFAWGSDWPMWRCDARRSALCAEELAPQLHLQWAREYPRLRPAWPPDSARPDPYAPRLLFDAVYEPVAMGKSLFVGSSHNDRLAALDLETGDEKWAFYADGPIRLAPAALNGKVYSVSDDGHLYCLDAAKGGLLWKRRGGPSDRKVLGNVRLISAWPARGGPVVADGKVYFAAGIFPFLKTFIHALDAETGQPVWMTVSDQVAPQGHLAIVGDRLGVPGGHSAPAWCDLKTGRLERYAGGYRGGASGAQGGFFLAAGAGAHYVAGAIHGDGGTMRIGLEYNRDWEKEGVHLLRGCSEPVIDADALYCVELKERVLRALDARNAKWDSVDNKGRKVGWRLPELWRLPLPESATPPSVPATAAAKVHLRAGPRLYLNVGRTILAVDLPREGREARVSWSAELDGTPGTMLAADGRLVVVTFEGTIHCFGPKPAAPRIHKPHKEKKAQPSDQWALAATEILKTASATEGYCLALGLGTGRLVEELIGQSQLHIIGLDPDATKVGSLRRRFDEAGLYGTRVALHHGKLAGFACPPYVASLIVSEDPAAAGIDDGAAFVRKVFEALRPYGGTACLALPEEKRRLFEASVAGAELETAEVRRVGPLLLMKRPGGPPGAGSWTHQYADAGNTCCSRDTAQAPLSVLWFGGTLTDKIILGGGNCGPSPLVAGGRLFMAGPDIIRAVDAYTGRILWTVDLPKVSRWTGGYPGIYHRNLYVVAEDGLYVAYDRSCLRLDPATGAKLAELKLPGPQGRGPTIGHILLLRDTLIVAADALGERGPAASDRSKGLAGLDRRTGRVLWTLDAQQCFTHTAIAAGNGRVFCVDGPPRPRDEKEVRPRAGRLLALDARGGAVAWSIPTEISGHWLAYSEVHDVLLEAGRGAAAYRGKDGALLWRKPGLSAGRPLVIHDDTAIEQGSNRGVPPATGYSLLTGEPRMVKDPRTGQMVPWQCSRGKCASGIASQNLFIFREDYAAYLDLKAHRKVHLTGIKVGCSTPGIPADGVVAMPLYARHCTCSFQLMTSLALVPLPEGPEE